MAEFDVVITLDDGADIKRVLTELVENMPEVQKCVAYGGALTVEGHEVIGPAMVVRSAGIIDLRH